MLWDDRWATVWEGRKKEKDNEARDGLDYVTSGTWERWMCRCDWLASGEVPPKRRRKTRVIEGGIGKEVEWRKCKSWAECSKRSKSFTTEQYPGE